MNRKHIRFFSAFALLVILASVAASAATNYLSTYSSYVSSSALEAASIASPLAPDLSGEKLSIYRLGYAAGYDAAQSESIMRGPSENTPAKHNGTYVLNTKSFRIHYPDCNSVNSLNESNKLYVYNTSVQEIQEKEKRYRPCGVCNPQ